MKVLFVSPEIRIDCKENEKFKIVKKIKNFVLNDYQMDQVLLIDGVRIKSKFGWWLIRASNTQAALIIRAEGFSKTNLDILLKEISKYLIKADSNINLYEYL